MRTALDILEEAGVDCASSEMQEVARCMESAADGLSTIFIGPSGSGKTFIAKLTAQLIMERRQLELFGQVDKNIDPPVIDCTRINAALSQSQLWGHRKGSFSGAIENSKGLIEMAAEPGVIVLDEIGELPREVQAQLLNFVQHGTYRRLGEITQQKLKAIVISTTNRDIDDPDLFRADLRYRFENKVVMPDLSGRSDRTNLTQAKLRYAEESLGFRAATFALSEEAERWVNDYHWPGGVRELEAMMRWAVSRAKGDGRRLLLLRDFAENPSVEASMQEPELLSEPEQTLQERPLKSYEEAFTILAKTAPDGWRLSHLIELTGRSRRGCERKVARAVKSGQIVRVADGSKGRGGSVYRC